MYSEQTLRKRAGKVGYRIHKDKKGYQLIEIESGDIVGTTKEDYRCRIEDIEDFLLEAFLARGLDW